MSFIIQIQTMQPLISCKFVPDNDKSNAKMSKPNAGKEHINDSPPNK